jgi:hypothetical protein
MIAEGNAGNRRTHVRKPFDAEVDFIARDRAQKVRLVDLSCGGARVRLSDFRGEWGDPVAMQLPGNDRISGHVVRIQNDINGVTLGVRFDPLEAETCKSILGLLDLR